MSECEQKYVEQDMEMDMFIIQRKQKMKSEAKN